MVKKKKKKKIVSHTRNHTAVLVKCKNAKIAGNTKRNKDGSKSGIKSNH